MSFARQNQNICIFSFSSDRSAIHWIGVQSAPPSNNFHDDTPDALSPLNLATAFPTSVTEVTVLSIGKSETSSSTPVLGGSDKGGSNMHRCSEFRLYICQYICFVQRYQGYTIPNLLDPVKQKIGSCCVVLFSNGAYRCHSQHIYMNYKRFQGYDRSY